MRESAIGSHGPKACVMSNEKNPDCPVCWRAMRFVRPLPRVDGETQVNVFECTLCKIAFTTEDHMPITGTRSDR